MSVASVILRDMNAPALIGYARVSTASQNLDLQSRALLDAGVPPTNIYSDVVSGASVSLARPGLSQALERCARDSTLVVWRIDRLGRSLIDVLTTIESLAARGVHVRSISDNIDPTTPSGRLMLGIFGSLAEYERLLIRERVQAGVDAARERGVRFGRPAPPADEVAAKVRMAQRAIEEDGVGVAEAARMVGWSRATYYRHRRAVIVAATPVA